ncbi:MAG: PAS domain S-box protein [Chitinophagaceae bacterium]|nr:PAS domain S-box protein [Chitinophagaceae bacterium]
MKRLNRYNAFLPGRFSFKKMIAAFFIGVLLVLAIIFFLFQKNKKIASDNALSVEHTYEVLAVAEKINTYVNEMQSGARGYIISGDENYLPLFNTSSDSLSKEINKFSALTKDNSTQQLRADTLRTIRNNYITSKRELINIRKPQGFQVVQQIFALDTGKLMIDKMRLVINEMKQEEDRLLEERKAAQGKGIRQTSLMTLFLFIGIGLLLLFAFLGIYYNTKARDKAETALRESEEFVKAIINNTSSPITIRDIKGRYVLVNRPVTKLLRHEENEIIGKSSYDFLPKEIAELAKKADDKCIREASTTHDEISLALEDGVHYFSVNRFPLFGNDGKVNAVGTLSTDITTIKKAEEQIREMNAKLEKLVKEKTKEVIEKETQYRFLIENMREGIQVLGFDWRYVFVNKAVVHQSKYLKEELLQRTIMENYPGVEGTELFRVLKICMEERIPQLMESEFVFPDGTREWFELSIQPVPEGIFILSMDITERKKSEEKLNASESRFRSIIEQFPYPVVTYTPEGDYIAANKAWETMWKYKREDVIGYNIRKDPQMISSGLSVTVEKAFAGEVATSEPYLYDPAVIGHNSPRRWMQMTLYPLKNDKDRILEVILILLDITENKEAEEKLKKYAEQLQSSNTELERFAYIASHDLQEPLRMVGSFLNLLEVELGDKLGETAKSYVTFAVDGAARMKVLVNDLLHYSRVGTNREAFTNFDLNEIMVYVLRVHDQEIQNTEALIKLSPLPTVTGNKALISQLLINLLGNALKYRSKKQPVIEIGYTEENDSQVFFVKDNGIGIDPKFFDKIFIIFQRLHTKGEYPGTGIGLAICKRIIEVHKGNIWVESKENEGSTFYFSIPKSINT